MSFLHPYFLILLIVPLILGVLALRQQKWREKTRRLIVAQAYERELVHSLPIYRRTLPRLLILLALSLVIVALARPYNGFEQGDASSTGRNIFIALDVSRSMTTQDVGSSRLDQAKAAACELVSSLPEDRLGMMVFSGESQVIIPLTFDHPALKNYLTQADPSWVEHGGTDFGAVLNDCIRYYRSHAPIGTNAIIIISDGEDTSEKTKEAAAAAKEHNLQVITVGTGTRAGKAIPDATEPDGIWKDQQGKPVISKLNPEALAEFAQATGGKFIHLTEGSDLTAFVKDAVSTLDKHEGGFDQALVPNDLFMYFAVPALVLLVAGMVLGTEWRRLRTPAAVLVLLLALPEAHAAENDRVADYAAGLKQIKSREYRAATDLLAQALTTRDPELQAAAYLAIGNACTQHSFAQLRELYTPEPLEETGEPSMLAALMPPPEPRPDQLRAIADSLRADIRSYDDALVLNPALVQASTNKKRVEDFIRKLEEEADRLDKDNPPPDGDGEGNNENDQEDNDSGNDQPPPPDSPEKDEPNPPDNSNGNQPPPQQDNKPSDQQAPSAQQDASERQRTQSLLDMYKEEEEGSPIPSTGGQFLPPPKDY